MNPLLRKTLVTANKDVSTCRRGANRNEGITIICGTLQGYSLFHHYCCFTLAYPLKELLIRIITV
jgi:hypothetical protein